MLPAVDKKRSTTTKEKLYRSTKERKYKHKLKSRTHKKHRGHISKRNIVQYSDVSSEELSSPEAGEILSDFDDKHGISRLKPPTKIITDTLRITRVISSRNLLAACSPLSNNWEQESSLEGSSMSTNLSVNNCVEIASEVTNLKVKKSKKNNKRPKSPNSKKKKKKKDLKHKPVIFSDCDNSSVNISKYSMELSNRNGDFIEPDIKCKPILVSHTPPLTKSTHINVSNVEMTYREDEKHTKHLRKEEKR